MQYDFTPAVLRAISAAISAQGGESRNGRELNAPELLVGLLSEDECRAAAMLAAHGLDLATLRQQWPELRTWLPLDGPDRANGSTGGGEAIDTGGIAWSAELLVGFAEASNMLATHPQPISWGTEHVLLAIAAGEGEASRLMREHGLAAAAILDQLDAIYGIQRGAAPLEWAPEGVGSLFRDEPRRRANAADDEPLASPAKKAPDPVAQDHTEYAAYRILDAAANRCREGLRVVEDFARFVLDDAFLTGELKRLRHDFGDTLRRIPAEALAACRDTPGDVGTNISTTSEASRGDARHVAAASFKRVEESLRSLEEYGKLIDPAWAASWEQLRYRVYTLERAVLNTARSAKLLADAQLYVLIDGRDSADAFERLAGDLIAAGVHVLQLRDKALDDRELLDRARILRRLTADKRVFFIMNDRPDLAGLADADGVHIGQDELSVRNCRRILGPHRLVGVSTHSIEQVRQAVIDGADYIGVGPVFASGTKQFAELPGLDFVRQVAAEIRLPAFAIGGITEESLPHVINTGLLRAAVSGAVLKASNPAAVVEHLVRLLEGNSLATSQ